MLQVLQAGTQSEALLSALCLILEYGSSSQKKTAMKDVDRMAYGKKEETKLLYRSESEDSSS
jgi:hypothetical protein